MNKLIDHTGQRFGKLLASERAPNVGTHAAWRCACDCGREKIVKGVELRAGLYRSCGCAKTKERASPVEPPAPGTRFVLLTQGKVAIVDECDFERVSAHTWTAVRIRKTDVFYAMRGFWKNGKKVRIYLHAFIIGGSPDQLVDHADRNTMNNRRNNLRPCDATESMRNRGKSGKPRSSKWKGVHFDKSRALQPWAAQIGVNRKTMFLGRFFSEKDAALAYDSAALRLFGAFAALNFPRVPTATNAAALASADTLHPSQ